MVHYSGSQTRCNNIGDDRKLIHEGKVPDLGCLTLGNNHPEILVDDGTLDEEKSNYLVAFGITFFLFDVAYLSTLNRTVHIDLLGNLGFIIGFMGCFFMILILEQDTK